MTRTSHPAFPCFHPCRTYDGAMDESLAAAGVDVPPGFRRCGLPALSVGDVVWYNALHQSRTGHIVRAPVLGRVRAIWPVLSRLLRRTTAVTLELELEGGVTRSFLLSRRDRVYVSAASVGVGPPAGPAASSPAGPGGPPERTAAEEAGPVSGAP